MASHARHPIPTSASSSSAPSSPKVVNFDGVTGISRPPNNTEHWSSYLFENHAQQCRSCSDPYARQKAGKRLCTEGNRLALDVASRLFRKDGQVYSRVRDEGQLVRVEKPAGYDRSWALLKAVERAAKTRQSFLAAASSPEPAVRRTTSSSHHYSSSGGSGSNHHARPVLARTPIEPVTSSSNYTYALPIRQPDYAATWPSATADPYYYYQQPAIAAAAAPSSPGARGSLYEADSARLLDRERREGQMAHLLEVREPSGSSSSSRHAQHRGHHHRRHGSSGGHHHRARPTSVLYF